jgi:hypothetical protein
MENKNYNHRLIIHLRKGQRLFFDITEEVTKKVMEDFLQFQGSPVDSKLIISHEEGCALILATEIIAIEDSSLEKKEKK